MRSKLDIAAKVRDYHFIENTILDPIEIEMRDDLKEIYPDLTNTQCTDWVLELINSHEDIETVFSRFNNWYYN